MTELHVKQNKLIFTLVGENEGKAQREINRLNSNVLNLIVLFLEVHMLARGLSLIFA